MRGSPDGIGDEIFQIFLGLVTLLGIIVYFGGAILDKIQAIF